MKVFVLKKIPYGEFNGGLFRTRDGVLMFADKDKVVFVGADGEISRREVDSDHVPNLDEMVDVVSIEADAMICC